MRMQCCCRDERLYQNDSDLGVCYIRHLLFHTPFLFVANCRKRDTIYIFDIGIYNHWWYRSMIVKKGKKEVSYVPYIVY